MGKISDALERQKKERTLKIEGLSGATVERLIPEDQESTLARKAMIGHKYSHKLVVVSEPESVDAENFKVLRGQVLFSRERKTPRVIMVTSTFPGEGKTFVSANLAVSIALGIDEHVLLVDCDLRRPSLHGLLGYSHSQGLHEYLTGTMRLEELIIRTNVEKLSFLPAGSIPSNPTELLSSSVMKEFLEEVRGRYQDRYIIIDSTPSQVTAETNVLANFVDGIILVVMFGKSPKKAVKSTAGNLPGDKILGIVLNGYSHAYKAYNRYYKKYYKGK